VAPIDSTSVGTMSIEQIRERLVEIRAIQARLDAETLALNARMLSLLDDPVAPVIVIPERELVTHGGLTPRQARDVVSRGLISEVAPGIAEVLAEGSTTSAHVDALGRGLRIVGDQREAFLEHLPELIEASTTMNATDFGQLVRKTAKSVVVDDGLSKFERQQRETFLSLRTDEEGCLHLRGKFDPISAAVIANTLGHVVEAMFHSGDKEIGLDVMPWVEPNEHRQARALVELLSGADGAHATGMVRAEVIVHIDLDTLRHGLHADSVCRTSGGADVPVETVRRLACDAAIIPVVLDGPSVPVDVGRAKRLATAHQRRALEAIHQSCAVPHCDVGFDRCHVHHREHWENGGATDLRNLVPLCHAHHRAIHEGGIDIDLLLAPPDAISQSPQLLAHHHAIAGAE
jgi:hypothetical protein